MATVYWPFPARSAVPPATNFAQIWTAAGTNFPVASYRFDATVEQAVFFDFPAAQYGSGNLTVWLDWYADSATSGVVRWSAQIAAITPDTDTGSVEAKAFAAAATVDDTHLGTTGKRLHRAVITVTALDSLAADDDVRLRIARVAANAADTMAGLADLVRVTVSYSDT